MATPRGLVPVYATIGFHDVRIRPEQAENKLDGFERKW